MLVATLLDQQSDIYTYEHTHIHTHTYIHIYTYTHAHIHIHIYTHLYAHTHIHTHIYTHIHHCKTVCNLFPDSPHTDAASRGNQSVDKVDKIKVKLLVATKCETLEQGMPEQNPVIKVNKSELK